MAAIALLLTSFNAFAEGEDDEDRRRRRGKGGAVRLQLNLAPIASGIYSVNGEYAFSKNMSAVLTAGYMRLPFTYTLSTPTTFTQETNHMEGIMVAPEVRYYFDPNRRTGPDKWYVGAYLKLRSNGTGDDELINMVASVSDPFAEPEEVRYGASYFGLAPGFTVGYTYQFKGGFVINAFAGIGYYVVHNYEYTTDTPDPLISSVLELITLDVRNGISLGWRF